MAELVQRENSSSTENARHEMGMIELIPPIENSIIVINWTSKETACGLND